MTVVYGRIGALLRRGSTSVQQRCWCSTETMKETVILDLDETLLYRNTGKWRRWVDRLHMYTIPSGRVGIPYPDAVTALHKIKQRHGVDFLVLSARWCLARKHTERWLKRHGLEDTPLVLAKEMHPRDETRAYFKYHEVCELKKQGKKFILGIGDRPSDMLAYLAAGVPTIMLCHDEGVPKGHGSPTARAKKLIGDLDRISDHIQTVISQGNGSIQDPRSTGSGIEHQLPPLKIVVQSTEMEPLGKYEGLSHDYMELVHSKSIWKYVERNFNQYIGDARKWIRGKTPVH
eukprot:gb/GECG01004763.1/.p1 GENE.gb/GECG01004763.1/~~gb/GECG01004763.1/.p1  ORF type:complete len:289 (+),score=24.67 gb/GECG01004763.1/:1-867(+)